MGLRHWTVIFLVIAIILLFATLSASWTAQSKMSHVPWIPSLVGEWADRDPNLRTAIPFVGLAFFVTVALHCFGRWWSLIFALLVSLVVLAAAEVGQLYLPDRTADWKDIGWGSLGALIGAVTGIGSVWLTHLIRNQRTDREGTDCDL